MSQVLNTLNTTMFVQLRGKQPLYSDDIVYIPIKPFTQSTFEKFYANMTLPFISSMGLDFYDSRLNYLGSLSPTFSTNSSIS